MNLKNLCLLASFAALAGVFSCKTEEKKESSEASPKLVSNDLANARVLELGFPLKDTVITIDSGNAGAGQQEFNADSAVLRHMPATEDNSDWYTFTAAGDTALAFTIKPKDSTSELDFVLFRKTGDNISADLAAGKVNALRSNAAKVSGDGSTGLTCDPRMGRHGNDSVSMSKAFVMRSGQTYYLVVNSPAGRSNGYDISFHACAPGEGGLADFEGNAENPEAEAGNDAAGENGSQTGKEGASAGSTSAEKGASGIESSKSSAGSGSGKSTTSGASSGSAAGSGKSVSKSKSSGQWASSSKGKNGSGKGKEGSSNYQVGDQETLYSIAFKMGMTVEELMKLNGMTNTNIYPGQTIKVINKGLSQKAIEEKVSKGKVVKPSAPQPGSTTDPKEVARLKAEKAAAEEARKKAIAEELKAKAAAAKAAAESGKGADVDALKPKSGTEVLSGRNPNFNPTPNFPVNNPKVNKGVETSNSLAPADKSFYVYCNVTSGVNKNPVAGVLQVVDLKKKDLVYNVQANRTQAVPLFNAGGKQKLLICDIFGYKKQDFDLNLDNIINDSTAQQVQIVDDTIVINFELRRLEKGDIAVAYNIFFYDDASVMLPKSTYELDQLLELMQENKKIKVKIHGHTNTSKLGKILYLDKGDRNFFRLTAKNKETFGPAKMLSKKRAETIKMYLESKKIADERIETEGHGGSQMLYPNTHPLAFKNKRVEVEILEDK